MATPLLDFLTGRARAALPFLRGFAARGLSPTEALAALKPTGYTFNRQRMLDVYAALLNKIDPERAGRLVGPDIPLPHELHNLALTDVENNYQYVVGAFDENGDQIGAVTVGSHVPLAVNQARQLGKELFEQYPGNYLDNPRATINALSVQEANVSIGVVP